MKSHTSPDPLPAIIQAWAEQLAETRAELQIVLVALAELREVETGEPAAQTLAQQEMIFDDRFRRYRNDIVADYQQRPGAGLLAMYRAAGALHEDVRLLSDANTELLAIWNKADPDTCRQHLRHQAQAYSQEGPLPSYIPDILRAFFHKKDSEQDS